MNYKRVFITVLSVLMLTACGKEKNTDSESSSQQETANAVTSALESEHHIEPAEILTSAESESKTTAIKSAVSTASTTVTTVSESTNLYVTAKTAVTTVNAGEKNNTAENKSSDTVKVTVTEKSPATTTKSSETTTEPESKYDEEFSLDETPVIRITAGGDYLVRGYASNGQIYVDTENEEKVEITLDGVDISCSDAPAILVNQAKRCVIKLADGSVNYLRDGGNDKVNDGVIFSNDTLRIKGESGTLEITAGNAHGIASDDDVIIESGTYIINAVKSGIFAHDDITVNGGDLRIYGGTNGIKSKGTVNINGGTMYISGGNKEEKSSIYAAAVFNYTGGNVYAAGNQVTPPASTPNPYIVLNYLNGASAGSTVGLVLDGMENAVINPHNNFKCVLMLSPDIYARETFTAYIDGTASEDFTVSEGQNLFTIE